MSERGGNGGAGRGGAGRGGLTAGPFTRPSVDRFGSRAAVALPARPSRPRRLIRQVADTCIAPIDHSRAALARPARPHSPPSARGEGRAASKERPQPGNGRWPGKARIRFAAPGMRRLASPERMVKLNGQTKLSKAQPLRCGDRPRAPSQPPAKPTRSRTKGHIKWSRQMVKIEWLE